MKRLYLWLGLVALASLLLVVACGPATEQPAANQETTATEAALVRQQDVEAAGQATPTAVAPAPASPSPPVPSPAPTLTQAVTQINSHDDVPRITAQELKRLLDAGQAVAFDARGKRSFDQKHIAGAISLPQNQVAARLDELPADKLAVFYCT